MKRTENREQSVDQQTLTSVTITVTQPNRESRNRITVFRSGRKILFIGVGGGGGIKSIYIGLYKTPNKTLSCLVTNKGFLKNRPQLMLRIYVEVNFFISANFCFSLF